jgi:hypothetical protein
MGQGIPVTITNIGTAITPGAMGAPVTLVGGTAVAITDGQVVTMDVDGSSKDVTFTVADGAITGIATADPA